MHLLVLSTIWPHPSHTLQAANIILYELLVGLRKHCDLTLLKVDRDSDERRDSHETHGVNLLTRAGVDIAHPLSVTSDHNARSLSQYFYPAARARRALHNAINTKEFDALLVPLSEFATILSADLDLTKFAYYGNPEPKVRRARAELDRIYAPPKSRTKQLKEKVGDRLFEQAHLAEMKKFDLLGNVADNDAAYYADAGHPRAFYMRNVWIRRNQPERHEHAAETIIVANVGRLTSTANSLGLTYLAHQVLPLLVQQMRRQFSVHLLGAGEPFADLRARLERYPQVHFRGFVRDIDAELSRANIFLCVNNATMFKVCHTRFLHAWSLGMCVIAHTDAALSIPEMRHRDNALLGSTPQQLVDLIEEAADDPELRRTIGEGGYATFSEHFTGDAVAPDLVRLFSGAV